MERKIETPEIIEVICWDYILEIRWKLSYLGFKVLRLTIALVTACGRN